MSKILITVEELMDSYSLSQENFDYLVKQHALVPIKLGLQTFVTLSDIEEMIEHISMKHLYEINGLEYQPKAQKSANKKRRGLKNDKTK